MNRLAVSRQQISDWPVVVTLIVLGLVSRIPFASHILYHWDSINYTLALKNYNISLHQPQPPGYLLYVLLTRLVYAFVQNPNWTFVGINIVLSTLGAIVLYFLGKRMFNRSVGLAASLMLLLGPLFWFYSEIALPNVIDALVVSLTALFLWEVAQGNQGYIIPSALLLGIAGGFRQQTMVFMAPLAVLAFRKLRFSQMVLGAAVTAVTFLASFIPMVALTGGLDKYQAAVNNLSTTFFTRSSILMGGGLTGLESNVGKWVSFTLYSLVLAVLPLAVWPIVRRRSWGAALRDERTWFLIAWIVPSLAFYTFIHMGGHGLIFTYLPAVLLLCAKALYDLAALFQSRRVIVFNVGLLAILLVNVVIFAVLPSQPLAGKNFKIVNSNTVQSNDHFYATRFSMIRQKFDPQTTVILASQWRHSQYYLPQYTVLSASCAQVESQPDASLLYVVKDGQYRETSPQNLATMLPTKVQTVVLFDDQAGCALPSFRNDRLQKFSLEGEDLYYIQLKDSEALNYVDGKYTVLP